jgi:hypothetical protein
VSKFATDDRMDLPQGLMSVLKNSPSTAKDSARSFPSGRVPHVCVGVAGALHGLNKMGRSPFRGSLFACSEAKETRRTYPAALKSSGGTAKSGAFITRLETMTAAQLAERPERMLIPLARVRLAKQGSVVKPTVGC